MPELTKKQNALIVALICGFYIALRFWGMTESCLWFDEIFSVHAAEHPWDTIISFVAKDLIHPPLFYFLLKLWIPLGGESAFWLRLLPVVFSILALFPFWMICREMKLKPPAAIVALSLFAVNGSLIKYAQEVRMYSLLLFLSLFSIWLFSRFYFRGKNFWLLTAVNILLIYAHYFGWLVIVAEVVAILITQRIKILRTLLMFGTTVAAFIPWIYSIIRFAEPGPGIEQNIGWIARPGVSSIFEFAFDVIEPFYFQQSSADPSSIFMISIPLLLLVGAASLTYVINFKNAEEKEAIYLLSIFSAVPLAIVYLASWLLPVSIWGSRHLIIVLAPIVIIIAILITSIAIIRPLRYSLIGALYLLIGVAFILPLRAEQPKFIWCAWESLATGWITAPHYSAEPKRLYVFEDLIAYHFWFATRTLPNYEVKVVKGMEGIQEDTAYFLPRGFGDVERLDVASLSGDSFWIAFRDSKPDDTPGIPWITEQKPPLSILGERGHVPTDVRKFEASGQVAYLILMIRDPTRVPQR